MALLSNIDVVMNPALVSIIIPFWNGERFVGEAIESTLAQTYSDTEVLVIDDGSLPTTASASQQRLWTV